MNEWDNLADKIIFNNEIIIYNKKFVLIILFLKQPNTLAAGY